MKFAFLQIVSLIIISNISFAQKNHDCKIYRSIFEFRDNDTTNDLYFEIVERNKADISLEGGTSFDMYFPDRKISRKFKKQVVWGVFKDSAFFMNNRRFSRNDGFNLVEYHGYRYFLMIGFVSKYEIDAKIYKGYYANGAITGAISGLVAGAINSIPVLMGIAYDIIKNKFFYLNEIGVNELLKENPDELEEYNKLLEKKDYRSVFSIIEKMDREEYKLSKD